MHDDTHLKNTFELYHTSLYATWPVQVGVMEDGADAGSVMLPFPVFCLGWFCLGYHLSDSLGRVSAIRELIAASGIVPCDICTECNVRIVLQRILDCHPRWLTMGMSPLASVTVQTSTCC